jgi:hypothetical protein
MKCLRLSASAVACVLAACASMGAANAATLNFSFDMTYNAAASAAGTAGTTTNLVDYSVGLVDGQTYHASFSYDPSASPTSTSTNFPFNIALYPATLSFSIPSLTVSNAGATADVHDAVVSLADFLRVSAITQPAAPTGHIITDEALFFMNANSSTLFTTTALPTTLNLSDFFSPQFLLEQDDSLATGASFGSTALVFDLTNVSVASETPVPAALPLFATGLGGLGLLGWRRKKKAAPFAA